MESRSTLDGGDRPRLVRKARLRWDAARGAHVLLVPEGVLTLQGSAREVLDLCDGVRTVDEITRELVRRHPGAPVEREASALLEKLHARGLIELVRAPAAP